MIGYRDMTFCTFHSSCTKGNSCHRAFTAEVAAGAVKWWGSIGAPVSQFSEKPSCHESGPQEPSAADPSADMD